MPISVVGCFFFKPVSISYNSFSIVLTPYCAIFTISSTYLNKLLKHKVAIIVTLYVLYLPFILWRMFILAISITVCIVCNKMLKQKKCILLITTLPKYWYMYMPLYRGINIMYRYHNKESSLILNGRFKLHNVILIPTSFYLQIFNKIRQLLVQESVLFFFYMFMSFNQHVHVKFLVTVLSILYCHANREYLQ